MRRLGKPGIPNPARSAHRPCLGPDAFCAPRGGRTNVQAAPGRLSRRRLDPGFCPAAHSVRSLPRLRGSGGEGADESDARALAECRKPVPRLRTQSLGRHLRAPHPASAPLAGPRDRAASASPSRSGEGPEKSTTRSNSPISSDCYVDRIGCAHNTPSIMRATPASRWVRATFRPYNLTIGKVPILAGRAGGWLRLRGMRIV
jgi:hypothetical protein